MKKVILRIISAVLLSALLLCGCSTRINKSSSTAMPKTMQAFYKMSDKQLAEKFRYYVLFTDSKNIHADSCFDFYTYIVTSNEYPKNYINKWYSKKDKKWHVPVAEVKKVLNKYLEKVNFNPAEMYSYSANNPYNPKTNQINFFLSPSVNKVSTKILKKERLSNDTMRITVNNTDETWSTGEDKVAFTLKFTDSGFKYLSIIQD